MAFEKLKNTVDGCPPLRPIFSAIGMSSYKIAKYLVPRMNCITCNEFTVKYSVCFTKNRKVGQGRSLVMSSLDVNLLFTNISLDEAIDICTNTIYKQEDVIKGIDKDRLQDFLSLATK